MIMSASITCTEGVMNGDSFAVFYVSCLFFVARNMAGIRKITENILSVNFENVSCELNAGCLCGIEGYKTARIKCLLFWHFVSIYILLAYTQFVLVSYDASVGLFTGNLGKARLGLMQDLSEDNNFSRGNIVDLGLRNRTDIIVLSLCVVLIRSGWGMVLNAAFLSCKETLRLEFIFLKECFNVLGQVRIEVTNVGRADNSDLAFTCTQLGKEILGVQVISVQQSKYVWKKGSYIVGLMQNIAIVRS